MTKTEPFKVGQDVWVLPIRSYQAHAVRVQPTRMVVDKVGRKYITCKYNKDSKQDMKFDIATGLQYCGEYSPDHRVYPSLEALWDSVDKASAIMAIRKFSHQQLEKLSLEQLNKACSILGVQYEVCDRKQ